MPQLQIVLKKVLYKAKVGRVGYEMQFVHLH